MATQTAPVPAHAAEPVNGSSGNAIAIWSLVLAVLGTIGLLPVIGSVLGIALGRMGIRRADAGGGRRGIAMAGFWIGAVTLGALVVGMAAYCLVVVFATRPS